jgi:hypothetical protein
MWCPDFSRYEDQKQEQEQEQEQLAALLLILPKAQERGLCLGRIRTICREPAARPVHAVFDRSHAPRGNAVIDALRQHGRRAS